MTTPPRWETDGRDWPHRAHSHFVTVGPRRWHVQAMGPAAAPRLLLLHGTGAATHSWRGVMPLLAERFRVIAPDLPGHGFTHGPHGHRDLAMPAMARGVHDLLATLEAAPVLIVGHSAGAAIAARMVLDGLASPRGLVGLSPALLPFPGMSAPLFSGLSRLLFTNPIAPRLFAAMARTPGETARFLLRSTGSRIDDAGLACYARLFATSGHCAGALAMMAAWDLPALRRDLPALDLPVLLLHGRADPAIPLTSVEPVTRIMANARLDVLDGRGHLAHEEDPRETAARIADFTEEVL